MKSKRSKNKDKLHIVKAFVFDVDGTLMDTVKTFIDAYEEEKKVLTEIIGDEEVAEKIYFEFQGDMYKEGGKYKGVLDMFVISRAFSDDLIARGFIKEEDRERVEYHLRKVYDIMPDIYPDALDLLEYLNDKGYQISFSTHSGDWGKTKIEYIWNKLGWDTNNLKYLSVPLDKEKDLDSWKQVLEILNLKGNEVVVVGDNPDEDIENSIDAGITRCIFVKRPLSGDYKFREEELNINDSSNIKVWKVESLSEIKELF